MFASAWESAAIPREPKKKETTDDQSLPVTVFVYMQYARCLYTRVQDPCRTLKQRGAVHTVALSDQSRHVKLSRRPGVFFPAFNCAKFTEAGNSKRVGQFKSAHLSLLPENHVIFGAYFDRFCYAWPRTTAECTFAANVSLLLLLLSSCHWQQNCFHLPTVQSKSTTM